MAGCENDAHRAARYTFIIRAEKAKTSVQREIPVGGRLAAVLDLRRHAPDGGLHGPEAFVFGNSVGERVQSIKKAWQTTVLKAHGHKPTWVKGKTNHLTPESRAVYRQIDLHYHDLRRQFGSRVLESGSSLVEARDLLGHSNIAQTSTYLQSTVKSLGLAIERKEAYEQRLAEARRQHEADEKQQQEEAAHAAAPAPVVLSPEPERIQ